MPGLAGLVRVERRDGLLRLLVDGQEFPWYIAEDGVTVEVRKGCLPTVTVVLLADRVEVDADFRPAVEGGAVRGADNGGW